MFFKIHFYIVFFFFQYWLYVNTYGYAGKHVEGNTKNRFYICIKFLRCPKDIWKMSLGDTHIMMFYEPPENVNLMHSIKFITITFLKYSFSVPPGSKNNWVYPMSHNICRDVPRMSWLHPKLTSASWCPSDVSSKQNSKHITVVLFWVLLTKYVV